MIDNKESKKFKLEQQKLFEAHNLKMRQRQLENTLSESVTRARSVVVGTAFGGVTEISMRRVDGTTVYAIFQPVEVIEFIHQLSAAIGCHIHIQPRNDFASWREWKRPVEQPEDRVGFGNFPPAHDVVTALKVGANLPPPEQQPGLQPALMAKEIQDEQAVATEKTL